MPNSVWLNEGKIVVNEQGHVVICAECPCDSPEYVCEECPDGLAECWELTVAGVTGGTPNEMECDCDAVNGTFTLERHPTVPCFALSDDFASDFYDTNTESCTTGSLSWRLLRNTVAEIWRLELIETSGSGVTIVKYQLSFASFVCDDANTFSLVSGSEDVACENWPSTVTIEPIACV